LRPDVAAGHKDDRVADQEARQGDSGSTGRARIIGAGHPHVTKKDEILQPREQRSGGEKGHESKMQKQKITGTHIPVPKEDSEVAQRRPANRQKGVSRCQKELKLLDLL
jgi:hypothetical protein